MSGQAARSDVAAPDFWAITNLSVTLAFPPTEGEPHPERTPVGPFPSREAADIWAAAWVRQHGGDGSWAAAPMRAPDRHAKPATPSGGAA